MTHKQGASLVIHELEQHYEGRCVLKLPEYRSAAGEHHLIIGPSGSGKTTLLHALAGLQKPSSGRLEVNGRDLCGMSEAERDRFRGDNVGIVFQRLHLIASLSVTENLLLARYLGRRPQQVGAVHELLTELGLGQRLHARPHELSLGEAQRVAIARAVINRPRLLLADEPTSSLDDGNAQRVVALLRDRAVALGATLLVVTHDARIQGYFDQRLHLQEMA